MIELVFDVETTGLDTKNDRIVEIGIVELDDLKPTGREFHQYINPKRDSDPGALKVHGLTTAFLSNYPSFEEVLGDIQKFIGDAPMVAHNGENYDGPIMRSEFARCHTSFDNTIIDTLPLSRKQKPGGKHSLDVMCSHFGIDRSARDKYHGALVDCRILAEVYVHLRGGRQIGLELIGGGKILPFSDLSGKVWPQRPSRPLTLDELIAHADFIDEMKNAIWNDYDID